MNELKGQLCDSAATPQLPWQSPSSILFLFCFFILFDFDFSFKFGFNLAGEVAGAEGKFAETGR